MNILSTAIIAFHLTVMISSAQKSESDAKVTFTVTRFDPQDRPAPKYIVKSGSKQSEIEVPLTYIAGPFTATLRDGQFLDFYSGASEKPSLSTQIPLGMRQDLLIAFVPTKESFTLLKIHAPKDKVGGGDYFVVNAMESDVAIKYGSAKPVLVKPGKSTILDNGNSKNSPTLPVAISQKEGEVWKPASTENWPNDLRFRNFLFLYTSARSGHMEIHGISERLD